MKQLLLYLAAALFSVLAGEPLHADETRTIGNRSYVLHVPTKRPTPCPLVLAFHGSGMSGSTMAWYSGLSTKADQAGFIVAYPNGLNGKFNEKSDVQFSRSIVADVSKLLQVDKARIFAAGMSNGGIFCYRLAAEWGDLFSAVAVVAGCMQVRPAAQSPAVSIIHFHGSADSIVPYSGTRFTTSAPASVETWAKHDGCPLTPAVTDLPDTQRDGTSVTRKTYKSDRAEVVLYAINGGGHTWPGQRTSPRYLGTTCFDINANDLIWDFFQKHGRR